jgi:thioredoxin reductase
MKVAIIGGGPVGVEAALYGASAGFEVQLFERGRIADYVWRWGFVTVFTEWGRNRSPLAARLLREQGAELTPDTEYSSGEELAAYVESVANLEALRGRIHCNTEVLSVTRERCLRSDFIGSPMRAIFPFCLLLQDVDGNHRVEKFDAVIDASGVYKSPNPIGSGGAPCPGELQCKDRIDYELPDVAGKDRARFAGKSTLVVGSGHSAASTLLAVADLIEGHPETRIIWIMRRGVPPHGAPYTLVADETSTTRARLHSRANRLIAHPNVNFLHSTTVERIRHDGACFHVEVCTKTKRQAESSSFSVNNVVAHTGFRADTNLWQELPLQLHPATGAPLQLGEALNQHNTQIGVGLSTGYAEKQPMEERAEENQSEEVSQDRWNFLINDPKLLETGEPNFFVLGIKSYGRDAGFLMHNGFRQVRDVYKLLSHNSKLDLYNGDLD